MMRNIENQIDSINGTGYHKKKSPVKRRDISYVNATSGATVRTKTTSSPNYMTTSAEKNVTMAPMCAI